MMALNSFGYDPNSLYGAPTGSLYDSPLVRDYLSPELDQGEFSRYLSEQGLGGYDRQSRFAQTLFNKTQSGYGAAQLTNPTLSYRDYLRQYTPNYFTDAWANATPEQRGENPSRFTGPLRWIGRG